MINKLFHNLEELIASDSLLRSDSYLNHARSCDDCYYHKSDAIYRSRSWRSVDLPSIVFSQKTSIKPNLILGHSDKTINVLESYILKIRGYKKIHGINLLPVKGLSRPIPLGLTNRTNESNFHLILGDQKLILEAAANEPFPNNFSGFVFGNFSVSTNRKERTALALLLEKSGNIFQEPDLTANGRVDFLSKLRRFGFVACPIGNGIDTHRIWETLYMGGIPIIRRNSILQDLLRDLPVLVVDSWEAVKDKVFLEQEWERLTNQKTYLYEKLDIKYWISQFHPENS